MIDQSHSQNLAARPRARLFLAIAKPLTGRKPVWPLLFRLLYAALLVLPAFSVSAGVVFNSLYSFHGFPNGANPEAGLVQASDGNFYGTTCGGYPNGEGSVFKITTNGVLTTLYLFTGGNDGGNPHAGLVQGRDGNFYGTTEFGGSNGYGTVFQISTSGTLTPLHSFAGTDGENPVAGLVQGSDGYFYGTTESGGAYTNQYGQGGTVFKITTNGVLTTLYAFGMVTNAASYPLDGSEPEAGLVQGSDGYFYGTTAYGGTYNCGTVFKISTNGVLTNLHTFDGAGDGENPLPGLVQGIDGNFYGTTSVGGYYPYGVGTVFRISTNGVLTTLYLFRGGDDGGTPQAGLVLGSDGNFYGTTSQGGTTNNNNYYGYYGYGIVYKITTNGVLTNLYSFTGGADGGNPQAGLVLGSDGKLYGTTFQGGTNLYGGTVFEISTNGALASLYSFSGGNDGVNPAAALVQGNDGSFYGTTSYGGTNSGYGTAFRISANGALTSLCSFANGPPSGLIQASDGKFYGTTSGGVYGGEGSVFAISTNGTLTYLHFFDGVIESFVIPPDNDGANPRAGLVQGSDGSFYGTTYYGGTSYLFYGGQEQTLGTVFKITTNGEETILKSFSFDATGELPEAGLALGSDGLLYGTTTTGYTPRQNQGPNGPGTFFVISTNGVLTVLGLIDGTSEATLVQGNDGNLYGTTEFGGMNSAGTVIGTSTNGLTSLYSFTGSNDGANPHAGLVQGSDGNFYGTTEFGGTNGAGTVFQFNTNGGLTSLYSFTGSNDGAHPQAGLVQGRDGSFYGTTSAGGQYGAGTVFRLTLMPEFQAVVVTNNTLGLTWSTEAGGTYQLQYNSDLSSSNWSNLGSAYTATGATLSTMDTLTNGRQRFYRLVLSP
jgi:uncharacterized repeat protein (TIGR03803 family)